MSIRIAGIMLLFIWQLAPAVKALDVQPRRWSHLPIDASFIGLVYVDTDADIYVDPVLELEDVEMDLDIWALKYIHSFESFGKSSRIDITQSYQEGHWDGLLSGAPAETTRYGPGDTLVRYAINLYGAPPLKNDDYVGYRRSRDIETIVGAGLAIRLPTGDYDEDRLINLGQNRFVIRPQFGIQHNRGPWTFEVNSEVAFYETNDDFFGGNQLRQDPLFSFFTSAAYTFRPGLWLSVGVAYDYGGENEVNGDDLDNRQQNTAWGGSFAYPLSPRLGVSFGYIKTRTEESTGRDSESYAAGIVYSF